MDLLSFHSSRNTSGTVQIWEKSKLEVWHHIFIWNESSHWDPLNHLTPSLPLKVSPELTEAAKPLHCFQQHCRNRRFCKHLLMGDETCALRFCWRLYSREYPMHHIIFYPISLYSVLFPLIYALLSHPCCHDNVFHYLQYSCPVSRFPFQMQPFFFSILLGHLECPVNRSKRTLTSFFPPDLWSSQMAYIYSLLQNLCAQGSDFLFR